MIRVLAFDPHSLSPATMARGEVEVVVERFVRRLVARASERLYQLLALCDLPPDDAARVAGRVQRLRHWEFVPVLYVMSPGGPGIVVPASFRPHIDGIAIGRLGSERVFEAMGANALSGVDEGGPITFGSCQLDRSARVVRFRGDELRLTDRESEVLSILLEIGPEAVSAGEIARRMRPAAGGSPATPDLARRNLSRLRLKLDSMDGAPRIARGRRAGYRIEI